MKYAVAIAICLGASVLVASGCQAPLSGAPCPCLEQGYQCSSELMVCVPIIDAAGFPDGSGADSSFAFPDADPPSDGSIDADLTAADAAVDMDAGVFSDDDLPVEQ